MKAELEVTEGLTLSLDEYNQLQDELRTLRALRSPSEPQAPLPEARGAEDEMVDAEAQIKHMVNRFLGWRLPENFNPDAGISFKPTFNDHLPVPMKHEPTGTNLFDAQQAEAMVRYMIEGLPRPPMRQGRGMINPLVMQQSVL